MEVMDNSTLNDNANVDEENSNRSKKVEPGSRRHLSYFEIEDENGQRSEYKSAAVPKNQNEQRSDD